MSISCYELIRNQGSYFPTALSPGSTFSISWSKPATAFNLLASRELTWQSITDSLPSLFSCVPNASPFSYHPVPSHSLPSPIWVNFLLNMHLCAHFLFITCLFTNTYNILFLEQRTENPCVGSSNLPLPIFLNPYLLITYKTYSISFLSTIPLQNTLLRPKCVPFFLLTSAQPVQFVSYFEDFLSRWKK